ncbi:MAG: tRNA (adenosine(37)-N6)-threonylcarbamoyltransferase complex transferase subunit TsaD [Alphaproteobacteria bacterium]|nr:tRNA (adenosine(37)-N6)-threonylcarbamoyltransferase complex transferase subunit TsaD [Alphaproteobacteria bacterium]
MTLILGIETSCDETAAALVDDTGKIHAERVLSQTREHAPYGGIVPEIAARSHLAHLEDLVRGTFADAGCGWEAVDAIAATTGPGLIGGVIVGATFAKGAALARGLPFVSVNHLEGHALSARLSDRVPFPYLLLLVSGGHCQLLAVEDVGRYRRFGTTLDDAVGEAFDKVAKLVGLGYPGGPAIEKLARSGNAKRFDLPRPLYGRPGCDFSFAGLKTAVRQLVERTNPADEAAKADIAASFQMAVADTIADRTANAARRFVREFPAGGHLVVAGGVAANQALRMRLQRVAEDAGLAFVAPPLRLCTDNAAMIAWAGLERFARGLVSPLDTACRPRWPLEELAAAAPSHAARPTP